MRAKQNDRMVKRPKRRPAAKSSVWETLVQYDEQCTKQWGVCASGDSSWGWLRPVMKGLEISGHGLPWFTISLAVLYKSYNAKDSDLFNPTANLILGMLLDLLVSFIVKGLVRRPRPAANKADMLMTVAVDHFSFPSGHCTRVAFIFYFFMTSFVLPVYQQLLLLLWTLVVCVSRVLLGRHYWTDVICGSLIGLVQGVVIQRHWKTWDLGEMLSD